MVYGGKPSRGCQTCKTRKIKCDETQPSCLQCKKSSRNCLGYPDEADLIFRNQNDKVVRKAQNTQTSRRKASTSPSSQLAQSLQRRGNACALEISEEQNSPFLQHVSSCSMTRFFEAVTSTNTIQPPPTLPIEEQVVHVYFKNFATLYRNEDTARGLLPFLVPMYSASAEGSALRKATRAAALCAISQLPAQRQLANKAAQMYSKAIMAVAGALRDPVQAISDETLQATLLLCLYESIRASDNSIAAWSNHVDGASAIVRARGKAQFDNIQSVSLFRAARTQMITNCIRLEIAPPEFPDGGWLDDEGLPGDASRELAWCALELPSLLAEAKFLLTQERKPETLVAMSDLIERAYYLHNCMMAMPLDLEDKYHPRTCAYVPEEPEDLNTAEAWVGPVHEYHDVHIASVLNKLRSCRMFATWIVMDCIQWLTPDSFELDGRWQHSMYVERVTIDEICSSVPFHLRWKSEKAKDLDQMEVIADMIGGLSLVWPLAGAVHSPRISTSQKAWMWGRLRKISQECGLEQAALLQTDVKNTLDSFLNRPLY